MNNQPTKSQGPVRLYSSPPLTQGDRYQYEIRVEWTVEGQKVSKSKTLIGKPGERLVADFAN